EVAVLAGLQVEDEEVGVLAGPGASVGAGGDVGDAAALVGGDAVDALMRDGDRVDLRLAGPGVVDHRIAAGVVLALLLLRVGVALLGAEVNLAGSAHIVARVYFRLTAEALEVLADRLVAIDDDIHLLRGRVELDEPGVDGVGMGANVKAFVEPLDDGEIALALGGGVLGHDVGGGLDPLRLCEAFLGASGGGEAERGGREGGRRRAGRVRGGEAWRALRGAGGKGTGR